MNRIWIILFFTTSFVYSQNINCDDLKYGSFESYEDNKKIGIVYRKGDFQIEKYPTDKEYTIVKIIPKGKCLLYMKSHVIKEELDTITWSVNYTKIKKGYYSFIGKAAYLNVAYRNKGSIKKISDDVKDQEVLKLFERLEKKNK